MTQLPTGTVALLFSDIEGSTALLTRLGKAYADALDGQRQLLRNAWRDHRGTELGTEGDSFFVVFSTAESAVAAAVQAQRALAEFEWPGGEPVRVRMGIHTGTPSVHDDGYVGMDVHRAARIAGSAHGGQVLISSATAGLVADCLPERVQLRDLGSHRLKDITKLEHMYQVVIEGLQVEFPPLKTLGAASSIPRPATALVGRDDELAELVALLSLPEVRLVSLTGPGGSGKTRLAIALALRLADGFPDGAFFVSLSAVVTAEVMWTSIAEVTDAPPQSRLPPRFLQHVMHHTALFVLDNLEQIAEADVVAAELLDHAPHVKIVASTRKPLALAAEHAQPVPPLELPDDVGAAGAMQSGAVQLFVQQARRVKPSFAVTADNAADVVEICRRLDGLPLAIELAAARIRLLSPKALVARIDNALDIVAPGTHALRRQKTMRDTIAWSYDLLTVEQQAFFRRLSIFAGGADLAAIKEVTSGPGGEADPLEAVADLADASLVTIGEDGLGEPRVGMLETVRQFAREQLEAASELADVRRAHADHYLAVARDLRERLPFGGADQLLEVRRQFQLEHNNFREILGSTLAAGDTGVGVHLYRELAALWADGGYFTEWRRWLDSAIEVSTGNDSPELGECLSDLSLLLKNTGDLIGARVAAARSCAMWRQLGNQRRLAHALILWASCERLLGDPQAAYRACEEAETLARSVDQEPLLADALEGLAELECDLRHFQRSLELSDTILEIRSRRGDERGVLNTSQNTAQILQKMGRLGEAEQKMRDLIPGMVRLADPPLLSELMEGYAAVLVELGHWEAAARLLGAVDALRERNGTHRDPIREAEMQRSVMEGRTRHPGSWQRGYDSGHAISAEEALTRAFAATSHAEA